jgi:hypothetical protein
MSKRALALWRSLVLGLWLVSGLPALAPAPAREELPPCCRVNGAHHCAMLMRIRSTGNAPLSVMAPLCPAALAKAATGARLTALSPNLPRAAARAAAGREVLPLPADRGTAVVVVDRPSRAPPRRSF